MYKCVNGWTKQSMIEHIKLNFKGKSKGEFRDGVISGETCKYRGPDGKKCAIGMFIPDDVYVSEMDATHGVSVGQLRREFSQVKAHLPMDDIMGLSFFQQAHDRSSEEHTKDDLLKWIEDNVEA